MSVSRTIKLFIISAALTVSACGGTVSDRTATPSEVIPLPTARPTITPRATGTLAPATLPIPKEATPTPTPVTYVVQAGDTPILIANKFGVSVADLIAVNEIDPATLQIGKVLIIPTGPQSVPSGTTLLPSPTPGPFSIRGLNVFRTPVGSLECLGEVFNPGPTALGNVQLQIALLDQADQILIAVPFYVALEVIPPNQSSPFRLLFTDPPAAYTKFSITPLRGESVDPASRFAQMKVNQVEGVLSGSQYRIFGEVSNADQVNATKVRIVLTTYDADQRVIGYRDVLLNEGTLAPNGVQAFDVSLASSGVTVVGYSVVVEALKAP